MSHDELLALVQSAEEHAKGIAYLGEEPLLVMSRETFEEEKMDAKADGYQDGWQTGYDQGHEDGRDRGREDGLEEARNRLW